MIAAISRQVGLPAAREGWARPATIPATRKGGKAQFGASMPRALPEARAAFGSGVLSTSQRRSALLDGQLTDTAELHGVAFRPQLVERDHGARRIRAYKSYADPFQRVPQDLRRNVLVVCHRDPLTSLSDQDLVEDKHRARRLGTSVRDLVARYGTERSAPTHDCRMAFHHNWHLAPAFEHKRGTDGRLLDEREDVRPYRALGDRDIGSLDDQIVAGDGRAYAVQQQHTCAPDRADLNSTGRSVHGEANTPVGAFRFTSRSHLSDLAASRVAGSVR